MPPRGVPGRRGATRRRFSLSPIISISIQALLILAILFLSGSAALAQTPLGERLKLLPFKIAYECYVSNNWEIFTINADGSEPMNLTNTPEQHEHYPQVSPEGAQLCFSVDQGEGREAIRSLWVMDIDGQHRRKLGEHEREPFWSPDGRLIGFLPQEYAKFNVMDYYTKGMSFHELATGQVKPHPNTSKLHHLYNPCFAPNGQWIVATVHGGMGFEHGSVLIAAQGEKIIDLKIPGCRAWFSPDGRQIAWGAGDYEIAVAPINLDSEEPSVGPKRVRILDETNRIIHVDWSPDSRFLCFSRGPESRGDPAKPGTFQAACGIVGVYAADWNLCAVSVEKDGVIDLNHAADSEFAMLTTNGWSNKEPAWFRVRGKGKRR